MSKGSNPRPYEIPKEQFRDNWDSIFGKKPPKDDTSKEPSQDKAK
jgi:hypothetical protein